MKFFDRTVLLGLLVLCIAFLTYFYNYQNPPNLFWDENYHIASAEKYLQNVFHLEPHPPLGKMLIALGEKIFHPNSNIDTSKFAETEYIKEIPTGYSFIGVRFFSALFAMLAAPIFYLILYEISKKPLLSLLFSSVYLFENAFIVHSRGAMLEGGQIFFVLLTIWCFLRMWNSGKAHLRQFGLLGLFIGLATAIKLNSAILFFFVPVLILKNNPLNHRWIDFGKVIKQGLILLVPFLIVFLGSYYLHFMLGNRVINGKYYEISDKAKDIVADGGGGEIQNFPILLKEAFAYVNRYEKGVPAYDVCKSDENGSPPYLWSFGFKSINYRWEKTGDGEVKYLYLQGNPVVWYLGLIGIVVGASIVISQLIVGVKMKDKKLYNLIVVFVAMYVLYMGTVLNVRRVLYLYHYFIPLLFSLIVFYLCFCFILQNKASGKKMTVISVFLSLLIFFGYVYFSPLTYYLPLSYGQFQMRNLLNVWGLQPVL